MSGRGAAITALALVAGAVGPAAAAANPWTDPANDAGFAPDIRTVYGDLRSADTIGVAMALGQQGLYGGDHVEVYVDSDLNQATGENGLDYRLSASRQLNGNLVQTLARWAGGWQVESAQDQMAWQVQGNTVAMAVTRARIGASAAGVDLLVAGRRTNQGTFHYVDFAPDAGRYQLRPAGANPGPVVGPAPADVRPPDLVLGLSRSVFRAAGSGPAWTAQGGRPVGTTLRVALSEAARVKFAVERRAAGRRVRGRCVKPRRGNRGRRRCSRWVRLRGTFTVPGVAGTNTVTFRGRLRGRKLGAGRYRISARAQDGAANRSGLRRARFRIVR